MSAVKYDNGKPPLSIIPRTAIEQEALVFAHGAKKYSRDNYKEGGMEYTRLLDAALRHIYKFCDGKDIDKEESCTYCQSGNCVDHSNQSHLAAARANLAMLMYLIENEKGIDDRYKK